jgi:hypothetical protein
MKKLAMLASFGLIGALVLALPLAAAAAGKTHEVTTQIVSIDAKANTLTFKDDKGESKTAPVLASAVPQLKDFKAGDKVVLTCQDTDGGQHEGISAIRKAATT